MFQVPASWNAVSFEQRGGAEVLPGSAGSWPAGSIFFLRQALRLSQTAHPPPSHVDERRGGKPQAPPHIPRFLLVAIAPPPARPRAAIGGVVASISSHDPELTIGAGAARIRVAQLGRNAASAAAAPDGTPVAQAFGDADRRATEPLQKPCPLRRQIPPRGL